MVNITVIDRQGKEHQLEAPTDMNMNLMEVCKAYELPVKGTCGGMALCSTCHVYVLSENNLPECLKMKKICWIRHSLLKIIPAWDANFTSRIIWKD